jgi:hypothetical protein
LSAASPGWIIIRASSVGSLLSFSVLNHRASLDERP